MNALENLGRWILAIPIVVILFYLLGLGVDSFVYWLLNLKTLWFLLAIVFVGVTAVMTISSLFNGLLLVPMFWLAPNKIVASRIVGLFALAGLIGSLISYWGIDTSIIRKIIIELAVLAIWGPIMMFGFMFRDEN